jgi:RNA polymerase sigma-70 factor (ECF subfamily)
MSVEFESEANEFSEVMNRFLRSLNAEKRIVFVRRYWYADSIQAIASQRHLSQSKVKSMLFRTRNHLKAYLEKEGYPL